MEADFEENEIKQIYMKFINHKKGISNNLLDEEEFQKLIEFFNENEEINNAIEAIEIALSIYPKSIDILIEKANILLEKNMVSDAKHILHYLKGISNNEYIVFILEIEILLMESKINAAFEIFKESKEILKQDPENLVDFYLEASYLFEDFELFEEAYICVINILAIDYFNINALNKILFLTELSGNFEKTKDLFLLRIDKDPYDIHAWINLGIVFSGLKLYEKAIDAYQFALAIDENNFIVNNLILLSYIKLKDYTKAIEIYELEISDKMSIPFDIDIIANIYTKVKKFDKARSLYFKLLKESDDSKERIFFINQIANSYFDEKLYKKAIDFYHKILKEYSDFYDIIYKVAMCYYYLKDYDLASEYFSKCVSIRPKKTKAWALMIQSLIFNENYVEAVKSSLMVFENIKNKSIKEKCQFLYMASLSCFKLDLNKAGNSFFSLAYKSYPKYINDLFKKFPEAKELNQISKIISKSKKI